MDKRVDNTDLPFEHDENIIGLWDFADFIEKEEEFIPGFITWKDENWIKRIEFLPEGVVFIDIGLNGLGPSSLTWTKDFILNRVDETCSLYKMRIIDDTTYLIFEWKSGDYSYREMKPYFYVLKKNLKED